jgi:hypothetical protein
MDTWIKQRQALAALGAQVETDDWDVDALDTMLAQTEQAEDQQTRALAINDMMTQLGG